jgi:hypothetical protein
LGKDAATKITGEDEYYRASLAVNPEFFSGHSRWKQAGLS